MKTNLCLLSFFTILLTGIFFTAQAKQSVSKRSVRIEKLYKALAQKDANEFSKIRLEILNFEDVDFYVRSRNLVMWADCVATYTLKLTPEQRSYYADNYAELYRNAEMVATPTLQTTLSQQRKTVEEAILNGIR